MFDTINKFGVGSCFVKWISDKYNVSSVLRRGMARTMLGLSRFSVGQWPCALDGYVSRIHNANSSLIGHRHDPRPSCAHTRSAVRAVGFNNLYACTLMPRTFTPLLVGVVIISLSFNY